MLIFDFWEGGFMRKMLLMLMFVLLFWGCSDTSEGGGDFTKENLQGELEQMELLADQCQDGKDNDQDGKTDCDDDGCKGYTFCIPELKVENTAVLCQDNLDNDDDSKKDCDDEDCQGFTFCVSEMSVENTATLCQDGKDNDDDLKKDCEDEDCQGFTFCSGDREDTAQLCQDKIDNDGDEKTDCDDESCKGFTFCAEDREDTAILCQDNEDNDGDNKTDCDDEECKGFVFCSSGITVETGLDCTDNKDNDGDGKVDCIDPDCKGLSYCLSKTEETAKDCSDNKDNDGDSNVDCDDEDCKGFTFCADKVENTAILCQDTEDNDGDTKTDCDDEDCKGFTFCADSVENTAALCQDNQDNDGDTKADCDDEDCKGFTFCAILIPVENTAVLCQDGDDNDGDNKTDCDDEDCQGFTFCGTFNTEDTSAKCSDGDDNDADGLVDCDDADCWQFSFCNIYNGSANTDSWGDTWDGTERGSKTWAEADQICKDLGGRLPTVTELYRNNATLTGDLGESYQGNYLWTLISSYSNNQKMVVRLSDGNRTSYAETSAYHFRCIWPRESSVGFNSDRCYGEPGTECFKHDYYYNIDRFDRAPLPFAAAVNECNFYGASLLLLDEYATAIHNGLPNGTNDWNWVHDYDHSNQLIGIRWTGTGLPNWSYLYSTYATELGTTGYYRFRCIGVEQNNFEYQQENPVCYGGCFENSQRASKIKSDSEDRDAENYASAIETCRSLGGEIHNLREVTENIHAGWDNGTYSWMWLSEFYGVNTVLARWSGLGTSHFNIDSTYATPLSSYKVRCVWHQKKPELPLCPESDDVLVWDGTGFVCESAVTGSSAGQAYNSDEQIDPWGNAWDGVQRPGQFYAEAAKDCASMGGRLPTATELYRVNATTPIVAGSSIGTTGQTGSLWTNIQTYEVNKHIAMRISDGETERVFITEANTTYKRPYRCIWPAKKSDILTGINCNGVPGSGCFETDRLIVDTHDRVDLDYTSAVNDCIASGGHIPDGGDYANLIHEGLENGGNSWLWVSNAIHASNLQVIRWSGVGAATWPTSTDRSSNVAHSTNTHFRCVYHKNLK